MGFIKYRFWKLVNFIWKCIFNLSCVILLFNFLSIYFDNFSKIIFLLFIFLKSLIFTLLECVLDNITTKVQNLKPHYPQLTGLVTAGCSGHQTGKPGTLALRNWQILLTCAIVSYNNLFMGSSRNRAFLFLLIKIVWKETLQIK